jgi:hypothetical protein
MTAPRKSPKNACVTEAIARIYKTIAHCHGLLSKSKSKSSNLSMKFIRPPYTHLSEKAMSGYNT